MHGIGFKFSTEFEGCKVDIVDNPEYCEKRPSLHVRIGSLPLMQQGHWAMYNRVRSVLASIGFHWGEETVSRSDLCVDMPGVEIERLTGALRDGCNIRRAKDYHPHVTGEEWLGLSVGSRKSPLQLRLYEKLKELKLTRDTAKLEVLVATRYGGEMPEVASRVEIQLRRDELWKRWQVNGFKDLCSKAVAITDWCTSDWLRLVTDRPDKENKNHQRAVNRPEWDKVCKSFAYVFGQVGQVEVKRFASVPRSKELFQQGKGVFSSALAAMGKIPESRAEFVKMVAELLQEEVSEEDVKRVGEKRREYEARQVCKKVEFGEEDIPF